MLEEQTSLNLEFMFKLQTPFSHSSFHSQERERERAMMLSYLGGIEK